MSCLHCYNRVVKNVRGTGQGGMYANRKKHFKRSDRRDDGKSVFARRKIFLRMRRNQKRSACRKLVCGSRKARTRFRNLYARVYPFKRRSGQSRSEKGFRACQKSRKIQPSQSGYAACPQLLLRLRRSAQREKSVQNVAEGRETRHNGSGILFRALLRQRHIR